MRPHGLRCLMTVYEMCDPGQLINVTIVLSPWYEYSSAHMHVQLCMYSYFLAQYVLEYFFFGIGI